MLVCYHFSMFCNMLSYTPVLQRNICICEDNIHNLLCVSTSKVAIYKERKTAQLLNVAVTYGQMHSLSHKHFKFPTSLAIAKAHHMLFLQMQMQQQAVLVTCMQACLSFHDEW